MKRWVFLAAAIGSEVAATLALKAGLEHAAWYILVAAGYSAAFVLISRALAAGLSLGVAYGIWAALGVASTAVLSHFLFSEPLTATMIAGLVVIIAGVLLIELGSQHARKHADDKTEEVA